MISLPKTVIFCKVINLSFVWHKAIITEYVVVNVYFPALRHQGDQEREREKEERWNFRSITTYERMTVQFKLFIPASKKTGINTWSFYCGDFGEGNVLLRLVPCRTMLVRRSLCAMWTMQAFVKSSRTTKPGDLASHSSTRLEGLALCLSLILRPIEGGPAGTNPRRPKKPRKYINLTRKLMTYLRRWFVNSGESFSRTTHTFLISWDQWCTNVPQMIPTQLKFWIRSFSSTSLHNRVFQKISYRLIYKYTNN